MDKTENWLIAKSSATKLREACYEAIAIGRQHIDIGVPTTEIISRYSALRLRILSDDPTMLFSGINKPRYSNDYVGAILAVRMLCDQIIAVADAKLNPIDDKINKLEIEVKTLRTADKLVESYLNKNELKLDNEIVRKLPERTQKYIVEAASCFNNGEYIACISMCGSVLEGILDDEYAKRKISERTEAEKAEKLFAALKTEGKRVSGVHEQMVGFLTFYRNRASHPTPEEFNKEKATIAINALFLLSKELFS